MVGRRPDGYHRLDTIAVFADCGESVAVAPAKSVALAVEGPLAAHAPATAENLVLRAAHLLNDRARSRRGAAIKLTKMLPAGAGFGGGSSDAAATLRALNEHWQLSMGVTELASLGTALGADVAMCVHQAALRARGIGEEIEKIHGWPALPLLLVWPGVAVSTGAIFSQLDSFDNPPLEDLPVRPTLNELSLWLKAQRNDLEKTAIQAVPEIGTVLSRLEVTRGCLLARMSGSGSGCFALYGSEAESRAGAILLSAEEPDWWISPALAR